MTLLVQSLQLPDWITCIVAMKRWNNHLNNFFPYSNIARKYGKNREAAPTFAINTIDIAIPEKTNIASSDAKLQETIESVLQYSEF